MDKQAVELYWQKHGDCSQTLFVARNEFDSADAALEWARQTFEARRAECPDGWVPLVMVPDPPADEPTIVSAEARR